MVSKARVAANTTEVNRSFYDALWSGARLARAEDFNTWPLIKELVAAAPARLEVGPGLRPRLPIAGTHFVDLSGPVIETLNAHGAKARQGDASGLPFSDRSFDLVCAFDVIEHADDDRQVFDELSRVLKPGGVLIFSVPLHMGSWTAFDDFVGHVRRYDPAALLDLLQSRALRVEKSASFGMQPKNPLLLDLAIWFLSHQHSGAMFFFNLFHPLRILFQKRLQWFPELLDTARVDEIVLVCRRG